MIDRYQKGTPEQLVRLARWLNLRSGPAKTVDTIPLEAALKQRDLLLVYLDALAALKRWPEVDKILANEKTTLEPLLLELFRARAAKELGQDKAAALYWNHVQEIASQQPAWLSYVGGYAEKNGELDEAKKAFKALSADPRSARAGFAGLIRIGERLGDTTQLKETLERMVKQYPDDPAPANDLTYVNLLLNDSVVESEQKARAALEKNPSSFAARTTLALSYLRLNKLNDAKELYQKNPIDWANALPSWQAVYVSVVAATGQRHTAVSLAQMIDSRRLKPEEKDLIRKFVR
jgi:tetratricopeptide (TPR) repeat protein